MLQLISTSQGQIPSLTDVQEFRLLARAMSDLGAHSVILTDQTQGLEATLGILAELLGEFSTQENIDNIRQSLEQSPLLHPYQALASGAGRGVSGAYLALALVHADAETAEDNVDLLRRRIKETSSVVTLQPWRDRIDSMEIRAEGRVLLARLYGDIGRAWQSWLIQGDPMLLHE